MGFENLAQKWLLVKEKDVKAGSYKNLRNYMTRAKEWAQKNIKSIAYGEIEDFLHAQEVSDKTRVNIRSCLYDFWTWLRKGRVITLYKINGHLIIIQALSQRDEKPPCFFLLGQNKGRPLESYCSLHIPTLIQ